MTCSTTNVDNLPDIENKISIDALTRACDCDKEMGIFDSLMAAQQCSIDEEYKKQRIRGSEYSQVYLGGMQAAMQNAVAFTLGKDKASIEAETAKYTIAKIKADIKLTDGQACLIDKQIEEQEWKTLLAKTQVWVELAKISTNINDAYKLLIGKPDIAPGVFTGVFGAQLSKTAEEVLLITQQIETEKANTIENVADPASLIGRKSMVHKRQADGFLRNAEAAMAKFYSDANSVTVSAIGLPTGVTEFSDDGVNAYMNWARCRIQHQFDDQKDQVTKREQGNVPQGDRTCTTKVTDTPGFNADG